MPCERKTSKAYTERPSPPYAANSTGCKGKTKKGNDGKFYVSKKSQTTGKYRWVKKSVIAARKNKKLPSCGEGKRRNKKTNRCRMTDRARTMARTMRSSLQYPCDPVMTAPHQYLSRDKYGDTTVRKKSFTFCPSGSEPEGDWIFYSPDDGAFHRKTGNAIFGEGHKEMSLVEVNDFFKRNGPGGKVWVTNDFGKFSTVRSAQDVFADEDSELPSHLRPKPSSSWFSRW